jgi:hypothetical protein
MTGSNSFFPMDAGDRTGVNGFLDQIFRAAFGLDHLGLFGFVIELKDLGADFLARSAANALLFNEVYPFTHFVTSYESRNIIAAERSFVNTQFSILGAVIRTLVFIPEGSSRTVLIFLDLLEGNSKKRSDTEKHGGKIAVTITESMS